jgi:probable HAF family extracellular repeat protein
MNSSRRLCLRTAAALFAATTPFLGPEGARAAERAPSAAFEVTALPLPDGCSSAFASAINDQGQVLLTCKLTGGSETRSFIWEAGKLRRLPEFGAGFIRHEASDINNSGQIAGSSWAGGFPAAAWSWKDGTFTALGSLGGANAASFAINASGQQTGWSNVGLPQSIFAWYAYLWEGDRMIHLGELPESLASNGSAISDGGQVVGFSGRTGSRGAVAVIADTQIGMHSLGTLGGPESWAMAINAAGQVVGRSATGKTANGWWTFHAFLWQAGVMLDLGTLPGDEDSSAVAINGAGTAVGWSRLGSQSRAVLWVDGTPTDLNGMIPAGTGWVLESTMGINAATQIIGRGRLNGQDRAFLLTPRP